MRVGFGMGWDGWFLLVKSVGGWDWDWADYLVSF